MEPKLPKAAQVPQLLLITSQALLRATRVPKGDPHGVQLTERDLVEEFKRVITADVKGGAADKARGVACSTVSCRGPQGVRKWCF